MTLPTKPDNSKKTCKSDCHDMCKGLHKQKTLLPLVAGGLAKFHSYEANEIPHHNYGAQVLEANWPCAGGTSAFGALRYGFVRLSGR